ncbi:MAG TPA: SMP-30/gluconolactonase/LRE family protein [Terriglobia bacterium]|nr:SMP-30/gluconolactonase/LRE family protein [Terriglobia bacterium]
MKSKGWWISAAVCCGALVALGQGPAQPQQGPGVQAARDSRYAEFVATRCKTPPNAGRGGGARGPGAGGPGGARGPAAGAPGAGAGRGGPGGPGAQAGGRGAGGPAPGGFGGGAPRGGAAGGPPAHREYAVTEIPGVIAAGQKWQSVWTGTGNNADGIIATSDGGILAAQNTDSAVMKIDRDGKVTFPYKDTNTGGALAMNKNGDLFIVSRGLPSSVWQLAPKRQLLTDSFNGEPLDCIGGVINDLTADSKGGVYFTMGGLYYANAKGVVTRYGENLSTNGLILSPDEKTLYVTSRGLVAFDVQPDGSLTNQRQFAPAGADGTTVDAQGRVYTTTGSDIQVFAADGKALGSIPTPLNLITVAFSGPDKKTLYGVANNQQFDEIFKIQMIAQGYTGRAK